MPFGNRNITTLDVRYPVVNDPAATAAFFANILPNLQDIRSWEYFPEGQDQWNQVLGLTKDLKRARKQESPLSKDVLGSGRLLHHHKYCILCYEQNSARWKVR